MSLLKLILKKFYNKLYYDKKINHNRSLSLGDYINDMYGVITNFNYNIPEEATWDIARKDDGSSDPDSAELPTLINVDSFSFKPIHNFIPRTVRNLEDPESKFISLGGKGYGPNKIGR